MRTIEVTATVTWEGRLRLDIPTDLPPGPHHVIMVVADSSALASPEDGLGWPPGFFEQTAGALADDPLVRGEQGAYEERDSLR